MSGQPQPPPPLNLRSGPVPSFGFNHPALGVPGKLHTANNIFPPPPKKENKRLSPLNPKRKTGGKNKRKSRRNRRNTMRR